MIAPPRTAEALLEALGATSARRDAIVGDLAEEFGERATRDGVGPATRWYRREAWRAAPHLVRDAVATLRPRDVAHLVGVALSSYVLAGIGGAIVISIAGGVLAALGVRPDLRHLPTPLVYVGWVALNGAATIGGGYIAGTLHERASLVAALALGALWSTVACLVLTLVGHAPWFLAVGAVAVLLAGTATGGILRVARAARVRVGPTPTA